MRVLICSFLAISCFGASSTVASPPRALAFEARNGFYESQGPGYSFDVTSHEAVLTLGNRQIRMSVAEANPKASLQPLDRMPGKANYFLGKDVRASYDLYGRVRWCAVYPGVDVVFRGNQQRLEYDFEIGAGRDPGIIQLAFAGIDVIHIDASGEPVLSAGTTRIHQPRPVAYQFNAQGQRKPVDVAYWIEADQVRFRTGLYDRKRPLVIDPQIVFDQSFGGSAGNLVAGFTRDTQGGLYVAGTTNSTNFPTVNPIESHLATAPLLVTTNTGQTWTYPSFGPAISVTAMAVAPSASLVVYAATPTSIFKSADGGTTWTLTASAGLAGPVSTLAVDAGSSSTVYAAAAQGVFISTDGAASWKLANIGVSNPLTRSVVAHPTQAGTVYASFGGGNGIPNSLIRSTDSGQTWNTLTVIAPPDQLEAPVIAILFGSNAAARDPRVERVIICTPDKDLAQCVRGTRIVQLDRRTRITRDETGVIQKFGVPPASIPDYLALVGDAADGYPGLPGWGAKSTAALLAKFGHIESIPTDWSEWHVNAADASTLAATLARELDRALLFRTLATLRTDIPLFEDVDQLRWNGPTPAMDALAVRFDSAVTEGKWPVRGRFE